MKLRRIGVAVSCVTSLVLGAGCSSTSSSGPSSSNASTSQENNESSGSSSSHATTSASGGESSGTTSSGTLGESSSTGGSNESSATGASSSGGFSGCTPDPGTYSESYTSAATNASTCPTLMSNTTTFPNDAAAPSFCQPSCSGSTFTDTCSETTPQFKETSTVMETLTANGATGTVTVTQSAPDGGIISSCSYSIVVTKM